MSYTQEQIDEALILAMSADQREIERLRAEVLEQCRLNAMGGEREARLMAQLAERDDELNRIGHQLHQMAVDLAESQAREKVKNESLRAENAALRAEMRRLLRWAEVMSESWLMGGKIRYSGDHPLATARALIGEPPHP